MISEIELELLKNIHIFTREGQWICYHKTSNKIIMLEDKEAKLLLDLQNGAELADNSTIVLKDLMEIVAQYESLHLTLGEIDTFYLKFNNQCNLSCAYCKQAKDFFETETQTLTKEVAIQAVKVMRKFGAKGVGIHGGEPLLAQNDLRGIISAIRKESPDMQIGLTCNGSLITPSIAEFFKEHGVFVSVELDGQKSTHDCFKRYKDGSSSYEDALRGTKILYNVGVLAAIEATISGKDGYDAKGYQSLSKEFPNTPIVVARIKGRDLLQTEYVCHGSDLQEFLHQELVSFFDCDNVFTDATAGIVNFFSTPCTSDYMCNCLLDKVSIDIHGNVYICPKIEVQETKIGNIFDPDFETCFETSRKKAAAYFSKEKAVFSWYSNLLEHCIEMMQFNTCGKLELQDEKTLETYFEDVIYFCVKNNVSDIVEYWQRFGF